MANDIYNYSVMTNTGKGFITHVDSRAFSIQGFPADVWVATDVRESRHWVARHNGVSWTEVAESATPKTYLAGASTGATSGLKIGGSPASDATEEWSLPQNVEIITD